MIKERRRHYPRGTYKLYRSSGSLRRTYYNDYKYNTETLLTFNSPGPPYLQENRFRLERNDLHGITLTGTKMVWTGNREYSKYANFAQACDLPSLDASVYVTEALSRLNPNNPVVDTPLFLFELREVPRGIRDIFRQLADKTFNASDNYLAWNFGWKPLISDLKKFANLAESMAKRQSELDNIARTLSSEGTLHHQENKRSVGWNPRLATWGLYQNMQESTFEKVWYTARFDPDFRLPSVDDNQLERLRWALGLRGSLSTIWNAIPWSWLIDYFSNVGTVLSTHQGKYKLTCKRICLMKHVSTRVEPHGSLSKGTSWTPDTNVGGYQFRELKERTIHPNPTPTFRWTPALSGYQLSILGALAGSRSSTFLRGGR